MNDSFWLTLGYDETIVIGDLSVEVPSGKITAVVGLNGCGKSTLLRSLARLLKPHGGTVYLDGRSIFELPTREVAKRLGILPQDPNAPEGLTVRELVAQGRYPHQSWFRQWSKEDEQTVDKALSITGVTELADSFAAYEKCEYVVPDDEIVPLIEALIEPDGLSSFGSYEEDGSHFREILVCTHGSNDVCCGKFGYPLYKTLRHNYAEASGGWLRVWRTSHIGGHRFAPTLMDFPEGRYWGHLEPEALENFVLRNGPVSELRRFYRGWVGIGRVEQIVERDIFVREGWRWTEYLKSARVLDMDEENDRAEVRIDYESPGGSVSGAYEATVEPSGSVLTLTSSGIDPLKEAKQYRVSRLKKASWRR